MVEQSRSRGRAEAWRPWIAAGRRPALAWPQSLRDFARRAAQRVREWATAEVAPGRLVPWLAIDDDLPRKHTMEDPAVAEAWARVKKRARPKKRAQ